MSQKQIRKRPRKEVTLSLHGRHFSSRMIIVLSPKDGLLLSQL